MSELWWDKQKYHPADSELITNRWPLESWTKQIAIVLGHCALTYFVMQQHLTNALTKNFNFKNRWEKTDDWNSSH